ncbi:MAG: hypothetical protein RMK29_09010 [Myxococcales bacterium]|nr:hypothetical protein [Myxococcota bacterium]MDW8281837.1 hypothetical protein [Myxococcales bacterium]
MVRKEAPHLLDPAALAEVIVTQLGIDLSEESAEGPRPLATVPSLLDSSLSTQRHASVPPPPPVRLEEALARPIAGGAYRWSRTNPPQVRMDSHWCWWGKAERVEAPGEEVLLVLCGGDSPRHGLPKVLAERFMAFARRRQEHPQPHLPPVLDVGEAWPHGPLYMAWPSLPRRLTEHLLHPPPLTQAMQLSRLLFGALAQAVRFEPGFVCSGLHGDQVAIQVDERGWMQLVLLDFLPEWVLGLPCPPPEPLGPTWTYMAPERRHGGPATAAADVFSAALLSYQLCGGNPSEVQGQLEAGKWPEPVLPQELPTAFQEMLHRALDPLPDRRPTAEEVRNSLLDAQQRFVFTLPLAGPQHLEGAGGRILSIEGMQVRMGTPELVRLPLPLGDPFAPGALPLLLDVTRTQGGPVLRLDSNQPTRLRQRPHLYWDVPRANTGSPLLPVPEQALSRCLYVGKHHHYQCIYLSSGRSSVELEIPAAPELCLPVLKVVFQAAHDTRLVALAASQGHSVHAVGVLVHE